MPFPPFEQRKNQWEERDASVSIRSFAEFIDAILEPSSEDRLINLPVDAWKPTMFEAATRDLIADSGFISLVINDNHQRLPSIGPDVRFKYFYEYSSIIDRISN